MANARCSFEELRQKRYVEVPHEFPAEWVQKHFERVGGWRFNFPEIMQQWREKRAEDEANLGKPRPLVYSSRRQRRKFNAQLDFLGAPADVILHPETAAARGIADGARVRVFNKAGEIYLTAKLDPTMRKGVGSIPHGHKNANVNFLTSTQDMDPLGGMAHYSGVPIEIQPA
jgi:anaerobic selenocysteine-containing dehydrogenase